MINALCEKMRSIFVRLLGRVGSLVTRAASHLAANDAGQPTPAILELHKPIDDYPAVALKI